MKKKRKEVKVGEKMKKNTKKKKWWKRGLVLRAVLLFLNVAFLCSLHVGISLLQVLCAFVQNRH
ncbi:hypothetical protein Syun_031261 [Stephania yunnanensis]|uniref:Uncharacterized protein n=1 Tax=Stephania yunnanensis TaxID=152371 RepID=A0AAP0HBW8_9MAGN